MFIESLVNECLIRVCLDGNVQIEGQSIEKEPLKVKIRPFEDRSEITLIENDYFEKNLIFLNNMNLVRVFDIKYLLHNILDTENLIFT